ncbi:MAG: hypothetical protein ACYCST_16275 [Acidimicrobiales bacterium]
MLPPEGAQLVFRSVKPADLRARLDRGAVNNVDFADAPRGFEEVRVVGTEE